MSKYSSIGRPAGYSSSEDELDEDKETENLVETCISRNNYQPHRSWQYSDFSVSGTKAASVADSSTSVSFTNIAWTKNLSGRRVDSAGGRFPGRTSCNKPANGKPSGDDLITVKKNNHECLPEINNAWVESKLREMMKNSKTCSTILKGSKEEDEMWLNSISTSWMKSKNNSAFSLAVAECMNNVPNPYTTSLHIMENLHRYVSGKKFQMLNVFINAFDKWIEVNGDQYDHCVDEEVQLRAFALVVRVSLMSQLHQFVRCFRLNCLPNTDSYIAIIRHLLEIQEFLKASRCILALSLQNRFTINEVCLPMLIQGYNGQEMEEYLLGHRDLQISFVKLIDYLVDPDTNLEDYVGDVIKVRMDLMTPKKLQDVAIRFLKLFEIPEELCPNVFQQRTLKAVNYMIYRKYILNSIGTDQWVELITAAVKDNQILQLKLIEKVSNDYFDVEQAAKFAHKFQLPSSLLPESVSIKMEELYFSGMSLDMNHTATVEDLPADESEKVNGEGRYHCLALPLDCIHWVGDKESFNACVDHIKQNGPLVGLDSEWRPLVAQFSGTRIALLQVAVKDAIYLLDMVALVDLLHDNDWTRLAEDILCNDEMLLLAYSFSEDFAILSKSVPIFQRFASQMKVLDLSKLHEVMRRCSTSDPNKSDLDGIPKTEERGLSDLVKLCLGQPLDKTQQMSDWERRPLRNDQLIYAALDAYCLLEVYEALNKRNVEFHLRPEMLTSGAIVSLKKTKMEKRQQKLQQQQLRYHHRQQESLTNVPADNRPITSSVQSSLCSPANLQIVCDTMLTGLGRHLRRYGVDVKLLNGYDSHSVAVDMCRKEGRILLTSGMCYFKVRSLLPLGRCYNVQAKDLKSQVVEVLQHFHVKVTADDVFSRCQICNGNEYLHIAAKEMKMAWMKKTKGNVMSESPDASCSDNSFDHLNLDSLCLENGVPIMVEKLPEAKFEQVDIFYVCSNCGKIYWEGVHHKRVIKQFADIVKAVDGVTDASLPE